MQRKRTAPEETKDVVPPSSTTRPTKRHRTRRSAEKEEEPGSGAASGTISTLRPTPPRLTFLPRLEMAYEEVVFPKMIWARDVSDNSQTMEYAVATEDEFWAMYSKLSGSSRHYYEIIREGVPCYGYWDLEADLLLNPDLNKDQVIECLQTHACTVFEKLYRNMAILTREDFVVLDISEDEEMNIHLIAKPRACVEALEGVAAAWVDNNFAFRAFAGLVNDHIAESVDAELFQVKRA